MVTFTEFAKRFAKLPVFVEKRAIEIAMQQEQLIKERQIEQHHAGVNREGKRMQTGYSTGYAKKRKKRGLQTRYVDLHFTGQFHKSLDVVPVKGGLDVQSKEPYGWYLRANFPLSQGLTKKNADELSEIVANILAVDIKKFLVA